MKLIAKWDFKQGQKNPLQLPNGSPHVAKGTVFAIGGDLPFEQLSKEQQMLHGSISHCSCPIDSDEGRQILAKVARETQLAMTLAKEKRKWTRGDKIALWSLIVAIIAVSLSVLFWLLTKQ